MGEKSQALLLPVNCGCSDHTDRHIAMEIPITQIQILSLHLVVVCAARTDAAGINQTEIVL